MAVVLDARFWISLLFGLDVYKNCMELHAS